MVNINFLPILCKRSLLFFLLFLASLNVKADAVKVGNIWYNIIETANIAKVTCGNWDNSYYYVDDRYAGEIIIPQEISYNEKVYPVTTIESFAFKYCRNLTSVTIPESVTKIEYGAFILCDGLTSISIPNSVTTIEGMTFAACSNLTTVILPEGLTVIDGLFDSCSKLTSIDIPSTVTTIDSYAFIRTGLELITIPDNVKVIGGAAFQECNSLNEIILGSGVETISTKSFGKCPNLEKVTCYARTVPSTSADAFEDSYIENCTLYVRESLINDYKAVEPWSNFNSIVKIDIPKHTLKYMVDGELYKSYEIEEGESITAEAAPTKEGYSFSGWSDIPATMPTENVTVTGTFSINNYNLIYKVDGEDYKTVPTEYNSAITPEAAPTKEGYSFSGWVGVPATMPAENVTVTGTFSINNYNLIYKVDGEDYKTVPTEYNSAITPEAAPTKEGYSFSGWSSIPATMPAEDITITGTFTICKYNLTYKLDGNVYQTSKVEYGTPLTPIANPSVAAYHTFSGWSEVPATMPAHDVDISGTSIPNKYKLEYQLRDPISGTYSTYKIKEVAYGSAITSEPAPTKEGCTFTNWTGEPATMPYYDVLVLGGFTANYYKLTYQVKGKAPINHSIRYGSTITPEAAPTVDGFTFNGWVDLPATMPAHDVTVNASLTKNATSNVTYPADWNLTEWSEETVSNLETDTKWYKSDYRYWYQGSCPKDESIELTANGVKIKETAGVEFAVSNCTMFEISTKAGGPYNVNIEVFQPANFFFVLKNLKRGQKVSIDFKSVDWYTDNDLFPQPVGAVKMTDSPTTRSMRTESSVAEYVVSNDGDVRFNVNADDFFYLYNVDVTAVSDVLLSYLGNPDGINNQIDCYLYWNGSSSTIYSSTINYARGADLRIENKSSQTMTITKIEMYEDKTVIGTFSDINGDLAPGNYKELSINVNSSIGMPSTLPWMKVYYTLNGVPYTKKFVSDGKGSATGINGHRVDGENGEHDDIYTIDGKKLNSYPTKKGLYIKNGKKFVVK